MQLLVRKKKMRKSRICPFFQGVVLLKGTMESVPENDPPLAVQMLTGRVVSLTNEMKSVEAEHKQEMHELQNKLISVEEQLLAQKQKTMDAMKASKSLLEQNARSLKRIEELEENAAKDRAQLEQATSEQQSRFSSLMDELARLQKRDADQTLQLRDLRSCRKDAANAMEELAAVRSVLEMQKIENSRLIEREAALNKTVADLKVREGECVCVCQKKIERKQKGR
jgi:DNA repair exonuclease SbcCD ATPase subunit